MRLQAVARRNTVSAMRASNQSRLPALRARCRFRLASTDFCWAPIWRAPGIVTNAPPPNRWVRAIHMAPAIALHGIVLYLFALAAVAAFRNLYCRSNHLCLRSQNPHNTAVKPTALTGLGLPKR